MANTIQTYDLTKEIGGKALIQDVNLHVKEGEIYGFLGPNGAGKTTVMWLLTNLWKPTKGSVELFGEELGRDSYQVLKRMGSIIEFPAFYEHLTGEENLTLHCEYMGYYSPDAVKNALELLELTRDSKKAVKRYSLGMKQRLGIARAILGKPKLLILDEPTNGLDPAGMKQIRKLLRMLSKEYGTTVMVSTHILSEIGSIADTIGLISHGRMQKEISMKDIEEGNTAYLELGVKEVKRAAYVLSEQLSLGNFRIMDDQKIRIYDRQVSMERLSRVLAENGVLILSLTAKQENLEDYFLKMTGEGEKVW